MFSKNNIIFFFILFLVLVELLAFAGCDGITPTPPTINAFSSDMKLITEGASATLSWQVSGATDIQLIPDIGTSYLDLDPFGTLLVFPVETTTYTLTATNLAGSDSAQVTITVKPPLWNPPEGWDDITYPILPPSIQSFVADPPTITEGGSTTLSWEVSGIATVTITPGIGTVEPSGTQVVSPDKTTTYTLTASNVNGSDTEQLTVTLRQTLILQPGPDGGKDSRINSSLYSSNTNFGSEESIAVGKIYPMGTVYSFLQFSVTQIPDNAVIIDAFLKLFRYDSFNDDQFFIELYNVLESWEEYTITWNNQPDHQIIPVDTNLVTDTSTSGWLSWKITDLVQGWVDGSIVNYGVALIGKPFTAGDIDYNYVYFHASDYLGDIVFRPKLEITYGIP